MTNRSFGPQPPDTPSASQQPSISLKHDQLVCQGRWLYDSYTRPGLSSQQRRETARDLATVLNRIDVSLLEHRIHTCEDADERLKLYRKHIRTQLTLRPPVRHWRLRYTLIACTSAVAALALQYGYVAFVAG